MNSLLRRFGALFQREESPAVKAEAERLRLVYRERCTHFRRLLSANKSALEIMADMEDAQRGVRPFGMHYVRGACTRVTTNVYQMARALNALTGDRYVALYERFDDIRAAIEKPITARGGQVAGPLVLPMCDIALDKADETGGKMANLGEIRRRLGVGVPDGFVVTASGFNHFMSVNGLQEEIDRRVQAADASHLDEVFALSSSIQSLIVHAPVPDDLAAAIMGQVERLAAASAGPLRLALRSSAVGEDALGASFAGQYRSELNIAPEDVLDTWREIVASKYGVTAMSYRHNRGIPDDNVAMCVGGLVMVDATAGGVAYSRNPLDLRDNTLVINSVTGLPKAVVDGSWTPDVFVVARDMPPRLLRCDIAHKPAYFVCDAVEGVRLVELAPEARDLPSIDATRALEIAGLAAGFEVYYGEPQDIEWAIDPNGNLVVLQTRPLKEAVHEAVPTPCAQETAGVAPAAPNMTASTAATAGPQSTADGTSQDCAIPTAGTQQRCGTTPDEAARAIHTANSAASVKPTPASGNVTGSTTDSATGTHACNGAHGAAPNSTPAFLIAGGTAVSPGAGAGPVYIVQREADLLGFPDGGVLVVERALPRWAPLLARAAALVTEAGGTAGHLASVAREYGVPALFGLEGAIAALEGAGEVTVDADNRRIHPGIIKALLEHTPRRNPMEGSPVLTALRQAASHIVPLHLLDPEAPSFTPAHCTTLHDITRFCHEKSVNALFRAEDGTPAAAHAGKQLKAGAKLQYWIIDMDDGFIEPVNGPVVDIRNIRSLPMLQLWDGMVAVPWAGPPTLDAAGFLSVVFESTANPDLEATTASTLSNKNFLMISSEFCNLQARFGYHFCTVEVQAGDDPHANYASFHFKGGAASPDRRLARARLVAEVLEHHGFRVDVKEDALFASSEGQSREETLQLARILGYMLIHTRQVDMIMHNVHAVAELRERLLRESDMLKQRPEVSVPYVQPRP